MIAFLKVMKFKKVVRIKYRNYIGTLKPVERLMYCKDLNILHHIKIGKVEVGIVWTGIRYYAFYREGNQKFDTMLEEIKYKYKVSK